MIEFPDLDETLEAFIIAGLENGDFYFDGCGLGCGIGLTCRTCLLRDDIGCGKFYVADEFLRKHPELLL